MEAIAVYFLLIPITLSFIVGIAAYLRIREQQKLRSMVETLKLSHRRTADQLTRLEDLLFKLPEQNDYNQAHRVGKRVENYKSEVAKVTNESVLSPKVFPLPIKPEIVKIGLLARQLVVANKCGGFPAPSAKEPAYKILVPRASY